MPGLGSRTLLVTAFEHSGDAVAAPLIAELRRREPGLRVFGLGGARMKAAGAELIETTVEEAVIGVPPVRKILEHRARLRRMRAWMATQTLDAVIPTDSPAANWAICKLARDLQPRAKVIHLVAPQLWAWASWRIRKMRRLSDHALCLLPFEKPWFESRGVPATFVGHPIFDEPPSQRAAAQRGDAPWPQGSPKLALLPGSRPSEWKSNWPTMLRVLRDLRGAYPGLSAVVAAVDANAARTIPTMAGDEAAAGEGLDFRVAQTDAVLDWADAVLAVSGTVTLQVAAHRKPMVVIYNGNRLAWHALGRWLVSTRTFALPNLIGEDLGMGRVIPEFVPHFGADEPITGAMRPLLQDGEERGRQLRLFEEVHRVFDAVQFEQAAADAVERVIG